MTNEEWNAAIDKTRELQKQSYDLLLDNLLEMDREEERRTDEMIAVLIAIADRRDKQIAELRAAICKNKP
jgi:uncharacterized protein (DUF934 family)